MKVEQKKFTNKHVFTFDAETLNFAYEDKTGSGDIDVPYGELPFKSSVRIDKNQWLSNVGYLWCAIGIFQAAFALYVGHFTAGSVFWLILGALCILAAHLTVLTYTVLPSQRGTVYVIQDGKTHDTIVNEIYKRRKTQLLSWYGEIDAESDADKEIARVMWLYEQKALTKEELDVRLAQIEAAFMAAAVPSARTLN
jgi:hypothetical protein